MKIQLKPTGIYTIEYKQLKKQNNKITLLITQNKS